jgi:hypothetical protein
MVAKSRTQNILVKIIKKNYTKDELSDLRLAGYTTEGWYFWDETWTNLCGPYKTKKEASEKLDKYVETLK